VREDFVFNRSDNSPPLDNYTDDISLDGHHWGIGASLGGTMKFQRITLEPFINAGYQEYDLSGDGETTQITGVISDLWDMDLSRQEWSIGGGISVLFDLP
jgi:hypothetical protein